MYTAHVKHLTEYHCDKCAYVTVTLKDIQRHCVEDHKEEYYWVANRKLIFLLEEPQIHYHAYDMNEEERKETWAGPGWYVISNRTAGVVHSLQYVINELDGDVMCIQQDIAALTEFRKQRPKG